jgi:hypothetical protein
MATPSIRRGIVLTAGILFAASTLQAATPSAGQTALDRTAAQQKYTFIMFFRQDDRATRAMEQTISSELSSRGNRAKWLKVQVNNPAEKHLVSRFDATRLPMPTVMAVAPNGAVTGVYPLKVKAAEIDRSILTPQYAGIIKALQDQKVVLVCIQPAQGGFVPRGVKELEADTNFQGHTYRIAVKADDPAERRFFEQVRVKNDIRSPVVVVFAPPGAFLGKFTANVTKKELAATLHKSGGCSCEKCKKQRKR